MPGNYTRTIAFNSQNPSGQTVAGSVAINANSESSFNQTAPANSSAQVYNWAFTYANLQAFSVSAIGGAATVAFYNVSSLITTMVLANGQSVGWNVDEYNANNSQYPNPFSGNITLVKVTCTPAVQIVGVADMLV